MASAVKMETEVMYLVAVAEPHHGYFMGPRARSIRIDRVAQDKISAARKRILRSGTKLQRVRASVGPFRLPSGALNRSQIYGLDHLEVQGYSSAAAVVAGGFGALHHREELSSSRRLRALGLVITDPFPVTSDGIK